MVGLVLACLGRPRLSLSSPAKAGDPVDASVAANLATLVNTGCSAFAEHDRLWTALPDLIPAIHTALLSIDHPVKLGRDEKRCPCGHGARRRDKSPASPGRPRRRWRRNHRHGMRSAIPTRHGRACPGHPRLLWTVRRKTWMAGTSPAMTVWDAINGRRYWIVQPRHIRLVMSAPFMDIRNLG